jgi:hypothetical protein
MNINKTSWRLRLKSTSGECLTAEAASMPFEIGVTGRELNLALPFKVGLLYGIISSSTAISIGTEV